MGPAEAVPAGWVVGVDLDKDSLATARRDAASIVRGNLACAVADGRRLPFHDAAFDAVLCHSMLETLGDPASVVAELRRVTKRGGVVGAAFCRRADAWPAALLRHPPTIMACGGNRRTEYGPFPARAFPGGGVRPRRSVRRLHQLWDAESGHGLRTGPGGGMPGSGIACRCHTPWDCFGRGADLLGGAVGRVG